MGTHDVLYAIWYPAFSLCTVIVITQDWNFSPKYALSHISTLIDFDLKNSSRKWGIRIGGRSWEHSAYNAWCCEQVLFCIHLSVKRKNGSQISSQLSNNWHAMQWYRRRTLIWIDFEVNSNEGHGSCLVKYCAIPIYRGKELSFVCIKSF